MNYPVSFSRTLITAVLLATASNAIAQQSDVHPASDPKNSAGWQLNTDVSDEFEAAKLDSEKWLVQGTNGEYKSNWIGRAPSQFSPDNVRLEDGKLKLVTKWEPSFNFSDKRDLTWDKMKDTGGLAYENITTAAVITKKQFHYGYMEIKCKAADASVTSAFWMTGNNSELDVFEFLGRPAQRHKTKLETELWSSIHDWSKTGKGKSTWTDRLQLDWRVAGDFHVYGIEWDKDYLIFFADGKQVRKVTRKEVGEEGWVITKPLAVWVDSETFPWHGIPVEADLPVDYEVEYIRVWQKERSDANDDSLIDQSFFSFEEPILVGGKSQKWWIAEDSREHFSITDRKSSTGDRSLKFQQTKGLEKNAVAFAPYGSMDLEAGAYEFSMKVYLERGSSIKNLRVVLEDPWTQLKPFDLTETETGKWVTLKQRFKRSAASGPKDRARILVQPNDTAAKSSTLYVDDLAIEKTQ